MIVRNRRFRWKGVLEPIPPEPSDAELESIYDEATAFRERALREAREDWTPNAEPAAPRPEDLPPPRQVMPSGR